MMQQLATHFVGGVVGTVALHPSLPYLAASTVLEDRTVACSFAAPGSLEPILRVESAQPRAVAGLAFHPTLPLLAVAGPGRALEIWAVPTGGLVGVLGGGEAVAAPSLPMLPPDDPNALAEPSVGHYNVCFSPSGAHVVAGSQYWRQTNVYELTSGTIVSAHWLSNGPLAFHPSGKLLALTWNDQIASVVRLVRCDGGWSSLDLEVEVAYVSRLNFSPDGDALFLLDGTATLDVRRLELPSLARQWRRIESCGPLPVGGEASRPDRAAGNYPRVFGDHIELASLCLSPGGAHLLAPRPPHALLALDPSTGHPEPDVELGTTSVVALATRPPSPFLAVGTAAGEIILYRSDEQPGAAAAAGAVAGPAEELARQCRAVEPFEPWYNMRQVYPR
jgi:WD40 repeat protein